MNTFMNTGFADPSSHVAEYFLTISSLSMNNRIPNQIFDNMYAKPEKKKGK